MANKTTFGQPGAPKPTGRPKKVLRDYVAPADDGAPQHLQDMRHAYLNQWRHDTTQAQEHARAFLVKDPKGFMSQMSALEKEHRTELERRPGANGSGDAPASEEIDIGTQKCVELCEKLILELSAKAKNGG